MVRREAKANNFTLHAALFVKANVLYVVVVLQVALMQKYKTNKRRLPPLISVISHACLFACKFHLFALLARFKKPNVEFFDPVPTSCRGKQSRSITRSIQDDISFKSLILEVLNAQLFLIYFELQMLNFQFYYIAFI